MSLFKHKKNISKYRASSFIAPLPIEKVYEDLKENIKKDMTLIELFNEFFASCMNPINCDGDILSFETNFIKEDQLKYILTLTREIEINEEIEFIILDLKINVSDLPYIFKSYYVFDIDIKQDFYDFIKNTKLFNILKDYKITNIDLTLTKV